LDEQRAEMAMRIDCQKNKATVPSNIRFMKSADYLFEAQATRCVGRAELQGELRLVYDAAEFGQRALFRKNEGVLRHY
jgi:hypothetical protein